MSYRRSESGRCCSEALHMSGNFKAMYSSYIDTSISTESVYVGIIMDCNWQFPLETRVGDICFTTSNVPSAGFETASVGVIV